MDKSLFANQNPEMLFPSEIENMHTTGEEGFNNAQTMVPGPSHMNTPNINIDQAPPAKRQKKNQSSAQGGNPDEHPNLFSIVRHGRQALQSVVDDWIEGYKKDKDSALLELINFLIQSCGCKGAVTPEMYISMDQTEIIQRMTEEFDEDSGEYPLIQSGPMWKKFRANFTEFIVVLVRQCQSSLIFDQYLFENIIALLTGLCDSQVRAFRHTSTLAAMKLMTSLVTVATNLGLQQEKVSKQFEAEKAKTPMKRAPGKFELLKAKNEEYTEHVEEVQQMMGNIFNGIFSHRYRDTHPEIRAICMGEIGTWIKNYPNMFLDDGYLRYVGWNLHDKHWDVRLKCVQALQNLYATEDFADKLELFTNRFKDRIVSMTLDKKTEVAVQAIKLITSINSFREDVLDNTDCESVYQLVFSAHRQVAQAAGQFLNQRLLVRDEEAQQKNNRKRGKKFSPNIAPMRDLVQYFIESELHEHAAYLVDSLWDQTPILKDWDCMTQMLLDDVSSEIEPLSDKEESYLIDIMTCCLRQASEGQPPVGRSQAKKLSGKEKSIVQDDKQKLTTHFIHALPHLLSKHGIDPDKVADLVLIPQYFEFDIYTSNRLEQHLDPLLKLLVEIVTKHTDREILGNCAKTFTFLCDDSNTISSRCKIVRSSLIDNLTSTFNAAWQDYLENISDISENEIYNLSAAMRRIAAFYAAHNLNQWDLQDVLYKIAHSSAENVHVNHKIVCDAIGALQHSLMWARCDLDEQNPDKNQLKNTKKRLGDIMSLCIHLMNNHIDSEVKEEAYILICDLLIYYGKQLGFIKPLKSLVYIAEPSLQKDLTSFVESHVFVLDEEDDEEEDETQKIEALHKRRNLLACFCKLIVFNNINVKAAADVFKHYLKFYNDYGDIIKSTLAKVNDNDRNECSRIIIRALHSLWVNLPRMPNINRGGGIDRANEQFAHIKDLAKNFSFLFNLDQIKSREAIQALHREGIDYALMTQPNADPNTPPPNIDFLEIVNEFCSKMMKMDKKLILQYLDERIPQHVIQNLPRDEGWVCLSVYRSNLAAGVENEPKNSPVASGPNQKMRQVPLSASSSRKRNLDDSMSTSSDYPPTPSSVVSSRAPPQPTRAERYANRNQMRQDHDT